MSTPRNLPMECPPVPCSEVSTMPTEGQVCDRASKGDCCTRRRQGSGSTHRTVSTGNREVVPDLFPKSVQPLSGVGV